LISPDSRHLNRQSAAAAPPAGSARLELRSLVSDRCKLDDNEAAYELFANQRDGVLKVAITP
jgi:threonine dehydrogenase-like Zn-dependent dehydrogenase